MSPTLRIQLEAGAQHLHALGARATLQFLIEMAEPVGELELLLRELDRWRGLTPAMLRMAGGDQFPRRLMVVPSTWRSA